jgi:hypothetical protein
MRRGTCLRKYCCRRQLQTLAVEIAHGLRLIYITSLLQKQCASTPLFLICRCFWHDIFLVHFSLCICQPAPRIKSAKYLFFRNFLFLAQSLLYCGCRSISVGGHHSKATPLKGRFLCKTALLLLKK